MKKIATLILAAGLVFGVATGANAIDFKAKGQWIMSFDYGQHGAFVEKSNGSKSYGWGKNREDDFEARQRVRLQLDAVASESLSGTVYFEIGDTIWGRGDQGGALGADGRIIELKNAYIDWMVPETDLKIRMGIQNVALPSFTIGSSTVMNDDVAAIVANYQVNENVAITGLWMRPFNDNFLGYGIHDGYYAPPSYMDNMDFGALVVPLTFDGVKITPWAMYGAIGPNTLRALNDRDFLSNPTPGNASGYAITGLFPVGGAVSDLTYNNNMPEMNSKNSKKLSTYGQAWWAGLTGELTLWDPLRIAWDFNYGSVTWEDNGSLNRQGWIASALIEYKMDWGVPGILGWYSSGDDNDPSNGSERIPSVSANNTNDFSHFAFNGDPYIARDGVISNGDMGGTWGVGVRVKDMSFIEDLKHTFRINLIGGTNSPAMAKKMSLGGLWANGSAIGGVGGMQIPTGIGFNGMYLTTEDYAMEFGLTNTYKMYENFTISVEADYIAMWLDTSKSVWGARQRYGLSTPSTADAWNINASFVYQF